MTHTDLDLDFPARTAPHIPRRRPPVKRPPRKKLPLWIPLLAAVVALWAVWTLGRTSGLHYADSALAGLSSDLEAAENLHAQAADSAAFWQQRAEEASATVGALESRVASLTADLERAEALLHDYREAQKAAIVPQKRETPKPPAVQQTSAGAWSREQVASTLTAAAKQYGLDDVQTAWIVETGCRVAYKESTYRPDARNGQHVGLFQFGSAWGTVAERLDPVWSCYRFVRVYAEGGEAKIRQHWRATV